MSFVRSVVRWSWLVGLALFVPICLPAGGVDMSFDANQIKRRESLGPFVLENKSPLLVSPLLTAPKLQIVDRGTPFRVLRYWSDIDGTNWVQVRVIAKNSITFFPSQVRGWLEV